MRDSGLPRLASLFALAYALDYALFVLSWWLLGRGVLVTPIDSRLLHAWALVLASMLPFRMLSTWSAGAIAVSAGELLKKRLLQGAMRLDPDELRADGAGRNLARVFESEAVETLALSGGLLSFAASIELLVAFGIVTLGARAARIAPPSPTASRSRFARFGCSAARPRTPRGRKRRGRAWIQEYRRSTRRDISP